jgi:amino acid adenylation domain-containing protein/thioester reductase-like protein
MSDIAAYPLSNQQKSIWYIEQVHENTSIGVISGTVHIRAKVDFKLLTRAIQVFLEEDENIRTRIAVKDSEPVQYTAPYVQMEFDHFDFSKSTPEEIEKWNTTYAVKPFKLTDSDLFYFATITFGENYGGFLMEMHHLICDGWAHVMIANRIMHHYIDLLNGQPVKPAPQPSYLDYLEREKSYLSSPQYEKDALYWAEAVKNIPEQVELKYEHAGNSTVTNRRSFVLDPALAGSLRGFCNENGASVFSVLFSVLSIYVHRITGRTRLSFGTPVLNRKSAKEKNTIGMFVSAVPLIVDIDQNLDFTQYGKEILKNWFSVLRHQQYPYENIFRDAKNVLGPIKRIYDITISYQNAVLQKEQEFDGTFEGEWHFCGHQVESLCMHISEREADGVIAVDYDYLVDVFDREEIEGIHAGIVSIMADALKNPHKKISELTVVSPEDRERILNGFNRTALPYGKDSTVHAIIEEFAAKNPDAAAVQFEGKVMTCRELNEKADALACRLINRGLMKEDVVAFMFERSFDIPVAMLGILKAGGAFLPIDPLLPNDRISYMLKDSKAAFFVTNEDFRNRFSLDNAIVFSPENVLTPDGPSAKEGPAPCEKPAVEPGNLAYVVYTSGSTGDPKGVMVEHRSLVNFNAGLKASMNYDAARCLISIASVGFDVFIFETLPTLMNGMKLLLTSEKEQKDTAKIADLIYTYDVDKVYITPSRLRVLLAETATHKAVAKLGEILCGGEEFPKDLYVLLKLITKADIYNQYGPTETTIGVTLKHIVSEDGISIGSPMANVRAYVLDGNQNIMPVGAVGELYIAGDCLARGYAGNPALTEEVFLPDPFHPGQRMYKTGDRAKWLPNGELSFLGRTDGQIKIRGFRVELKEIEKQMQQVKGVRDAVVIAREDNQRNKFLCAYYLSDTALSANSIKLQLHQKLPPYMIPAFFVRMQSFPLNANGKVDTSALPEPSVGSAKKSKYIAPANTVEQKLIEIWQKNLNLNEIGVTDNYFTLGGDSLSMVLMLIDINKAFETNLSFTDLFEAPTIRSVAKQILSSRGELLEPLQKAPELPYYPLSSSQKRLYILNSIDQNKLAYNMPGAFIIQGKLDVIRLENVFRTIVRRHDILRTSFELFANDIVQKVHSDVPFEVERLNALSVSEAVRIFVRPFDLSKAPLFRAAIMGLGSNKHLLLVDMHHIISDGAASSILMQEIDTLYSGGELPENAFQYKDFVLWAQKNQNNALFNKQREYWLNVFKDTIPVLELPLDFPRPAAVDFKGSKMRFALDKSRTNAIVKFCRENDVSLFMFLFSVWNIFLSKISGQDDIVVGTPSSGRHYRDLDKIVGVFINTLPIRSKPEPEKTFRKFLDEVKRDTLYALENQDYPYDQLLEFLPIQRDISRNPLFDTLFVFQNESLQSMKLGSLTITPEDLDIGISKLDLSLEVVALNEKLHFTLEYATSIFEEKTIIKFISYIETLISNILINADEKLYNIECITEIDRQLLLRDYNNTDTPYDPVTIDAIFDKTAASKPDSTAVVFQDTAYTFGELRGFSDQIAARLHAAGIGKGCIVGLLCSRNIEMIAGLFGIMKSGAAYMPIDPNYPEERIKYMLADSGASAIVYCKDVPAPVYFDGKLVKIDFGDRSGPAAPPPRRHKAEDRIYVIYTSGSTGKPKGVMIRHKSVTNFFHAMRKELPISADDVVLCSTTFCFDVFVLESLVPLASGMKIVLADEEQQRLPWLMADIILKNDVTVFQATPSRMRLMIEDWNFRTALKKVKLIFSVGEALPLPLLKKLQSICSARIFDLYGPTETTVYSTVSELTHADRVHIGHPINNTQIYVLSEQMRLLPPGAVGEMYIGGDGVALGYLNKPELTAERFIPDPFRPDSYMYRTGDMIRFEKDGTIFYIGRSDYQVKVRGFRIELGEIENCIMGSGMVTQVAVMPIYANDEIISLCAYFTAPGVYCDTIKLKQYIGKYLPDYMVPTQYHLLEKMPLTGSGKIDRKALPKSDPSGQIATSVVLPRNDIEKELFDIWANALKKDNISIDRSFFEMGGDSLSVIIVQMQYYKKNFIISMKDFYRYRTIAEQAEIIMKKGDRTEAAGGSATVFPQLSETVPPSPAPKLKNILVTGATGFLGAHVVREIMRKTNACVYCVVRGENPDYKLSEALKYYHGIQFVSRYKKRILSVSGDITKVRFGLYFKEYDDLALTIDTVVHCAADVRHYGNAESFYSTNVEGTHQMIEFAGISGAHLFHVSTISVAGSKTTKKHAVFSEKDFYVGQNYHDNEYVKSKFEAERAVIQAIENKLPATILRIGNLTGRYKDGVFQRNIHSNAFYQRLKALYMLKCVPEKYRMMELEFTPVDACARAILAIMSSPDTAGRAYHLRNHNSLSMERLIQYCNLQKEGFEFMEENRFLNYLRECAKNENSEYAAAFIQDLDENGRISFVSNIAVSSDSTVDFLRQKGFTWPRANRWFIKKVLRYMKSTNFIREA